MSRFNFSICSCVRPNRGGWKVDSMGFIFGGGLHRGVGVLECECMHVNACVCVWDIWCHANRDWWEEVNKQGQEPFRKCTELEMDVDNRSIRVLILLFEALLLFFSDVSQSDEWCLCVGQTLSPKSKHRCKNMVSVPLIFLQMNIVPLKNEKQHSTRQNA